VSEFKFLQMKKVLSPDASNVYGFSKIIAGLVLTVII